MGLTNTFAVKNLLTFCQIHCVNVNSLYDLLLPFCKKKTDKKKKPTHLYPYVFCFLFGLVCVRCHVLLLCAKHILIDLSPCSAVGY